MKKLYLSLLTVILLVFLPAVLTAEEGFSDIFDETETETSDESWSYSNHIYMYGEAGFDLTSFFDEGFESEYIASPRLKLNINPIVENLEALARIDLKINNFEVPDFRDIIDELYIRYFFPIGYLEAGLMKIEWGNGDGYHVLDPVNPINQTDGIVTDLNTMKDPVPMVKLNLQAGEIGLIELAYMPLFKGHSLAESGRWALIDPSQLPILLPNLQQIEEKKGLAGSTAALRFSGELGGFDWGFQYYYGYKPELGYKFDYILTAMPPYYQITKTTPVYTRAHLFGLEAGGAAGPFTFKAEAGYWLTEDIAGDKPELWNNSIVFLGGVDLTIPGTEIFVSVQVSESFVLNYDDNANFDVDKSASYGKAATTQIIPAIDFPFDNNRFKIRLSGLYHVEAKGWMAAPEVFWYPMDNIEVKLAGKLFGGDEAYSNSPYYKWRDNGHVSLGMTYYF